MLSSISQSLFLTARVGVSAKEEPTSNESTTTEREQPLVSSNFGLNRFFYSTTHVEQGSKSDSQPSKKSENKADGWDLSNGGVQCTMQQEAEMKLRIPSLDVAGGESPVYLPDGTQRERESDPEELGVEIGLPSMIIHTFSEDSSTKHSAAVQPKTQICSDGQEIEISFPSIDIDEEAHSMEEELDTMPSEETEEIQSDAEKNTQSDNLKFNDETSLEEVGSHSPLLKRLEKSQAAKDNFVPKKEASPGSIVTPEYQSLINHTSGYSDRFTPLQLLATGTVGTYDVTYDESSVASSDNVGSDIDKSEYFVLHAKIQQYENNAVHEDSSYAGSKCAEEMGVVDKNNYEQYSAISTILHTNVTLENRDHKTALKDSIVEASKENQSFISAPQISCELNSEFEKAPEEQIHLRQLMQQYEDKAEDDCPQDDNFQSQIAIEDSSKENSRESLSHPIDKLDLVARSIHSSIKRGGHVLEASSHRSILWEGSEDDDDQYLALQAITPNYESRPFSHTVINTFVKDQSLESAQKKATVNQSDVDHTLLDNEDGRDVIGERAGETNSADRSCPQSYITRDTDDKSKASELLLDDDESWCGSYYSGSDASGEDCAELLALQAMIANYEAEGCRIETNQETEQAVALYIADAVVVPDVNESRGVQHVESREATAGVSLDNHPNVVLSALTAAEKNHLLIRELQHIQRFGGDMFDELEEKIFIWQNEEVQRQCQQRRRALSKATNNPGNTKRIDEVALKPVEDTFSEDISAPAFPVRKCLISAQLESESLIRELQFVQTQGDGIFDGIDDKVKTWQKQESQRRLQSVSTIDEFDILEKEKGALASEYTDTTQSCTSRCSASSDNLSTKENTAKFDCNDCNAPEQNAAVKDVALDNHETAEPDCPRSTAIYDDTITVEVSVHSFFESVESDDEEEWTFTELDENKSDAFALFDAVNIDTKGDESDYGFVGHGLSDNSSVFSEMTSPSVYSVLMKEAVPATLAFHSSNEAPDKVDCKEQSCLQRIQRIRRRELPFLKRMPCRHPCRSHSNPSYLSRMRQAAVMMSLPEHHRSEDSQDRYLPTESPMGSLRRCSSDTPNRSSRNTRNCETVVLDIWDDLDNFLDDSDDETFYEEITVDDSQDASFVPPPPSCPKGNHINKTDNFYDSVSISFLVPTIRDHSIVQIMDEALRILRVGGILNIIDMNGCIAERVQCMSKYQCLSFQKAPAAGPQRVQTKAILEKSGLATKFHVEDPRINHWTSKKLTETKQSRG